MAMRKSTPRGQMTRGANSGPAIMLLPPMIRATFMPNPPLEQKPKKQLRRKTPITGVAAYMSKFEKSPPPERPPAITPQLLKEKGRNAKKEQHRKALEPKIEEYRQHQKDAGGEFDGMNCYNTLFIGRLAYEVTEAKLLREMESFGPVKDIRIVKDREGKSRGYAFCEFENEDDMKRAYRNADAMRVEGRHIVVDVERGHTVPSWLPRRLNYGLGGTRLGAKHQNVNRPGRFDPSRPDAPPPAAVMHGMGRGRGPHGPPPLVQYGDPYGGGYHHRGPPPPPYGGYNDRGPSRGGEYYGVGGGYGERKRPRSRSPEYQRDRRRY